MHKTIDEKWVKMVGICMCTWRCDPKLILVSQMDEKHNFFGLNVKQTTNVQYFQ